MRLVAAMFKHETNTFSPVPTPLERFNPSFGNAALGAYKGTNTPLGGYIGQAEALGAELSVPVAAEAWPSGKVDAQAYERLADAILEAVARGCEAVMLDLHGAMVGERFDDGEGELLRRIRQLKPGIPIALALDFHTNLTQLMVDNATAIVGYKTYPHVDMRQAGEQAGRIVLDMLAGKCRPVMRWGNRPMIPHIMRQATDDEPMKSLIATAKRLEQDRILAATVFAGFPHADIHDAGLSAVVVADGDEGAAEAAKEELLDQAWRDRAGFVYRGEPIAEALARARAEAAEPGQGPVILLDHSDNCGSGGTQDDMTAIAAVLKSGLEDVAAFGVADPEAVQQLIDIGVGRRGTVALGGKRDMPSIGVKGRPLQVSGVVRAITDGEFVIRGPMYTGVRVGMGRTAVIDTGRVEIVVTERNHEPWDLGCLRNVGIEPTAKRFVLLKSRVHWRAGFKPIAKAVVDLAGQGVTTSDYSILRFDKLRRPIYPLDAMPA